MTANKGTILVVDDDPIIHTVCQRVLGREGYRVVCAADGRRCLEMLRENIVDFVLLDYRMPDIDGIEVLRRIRDGDDPELGVAIITGHGSMQSAIEALRLGAQDYVTKPVGADQLLSVVRHGLEATRIRRHLRRLSREGKAAFHLDRLVGESPPMQRVFETVIKVAASPITSVLIRGETGTGKSLVAEAIHNNSPRADGPFVQVNCTAMPMELVEVELFGAEKGAYTDAVSGRLGLIEQAHRGTLFLDEVGHMPVGLQPKLLNVLEEKRFRRVGGRQDIEVDVRIVAATNRDLESAIREGEFRPDLYYRLNVIPITLPPLRERGDDVLLLAHHFVTEFAKRFHKPNLSISPEAEKALLEYPWPGNVRELRNVIERAVLLGEGPVIDACHLEFSEAELEETESSTFGDEVPLAEIEKKHILAVLERTGGNKSRAARILGVSTETLRRKLKEWGIV